jgi:hypothetical protein
VTLQRLLRVLAVWAAVLALSSLFVCRLVALDRTRAPVGPFIVSVWLGGARIARTVVLTETEKSRALESEASQHGAQRVVETMRDSAFIFPKNRWLLAASVAPDRDGVSASYQGRTAYATPDDLHKLEAYEAAVSVGPYSLILGVDVDKLLGALASELGTTADELLRHGRLRRFAVVSDALYPRQVGQAEITAAVLKRSVQGAARYLVRNQHRDGMFEYELNALTGAADPNYNYPRHAGATYFLARAANQFHDASLLRAARRAAAFMKDRATLRCGPYACIGEGDQVDLGAAALALLAYVELLAGGAEEYRAPALELAGFLRSQQRADGDFQHLYSVSEQHPIDVQLEYYTGEAAFALSRVARVSGDVRDLETARRALRFLVQRSPWFLGAHYFWGAEHWTCQVLEDLWQRAPDRAALDFCLRWQAANRRLQYDAPPAPSEYDGGLSRGPFLSPRLTPLAARMEAAVATLAVARTAHLSAQEIEPLEREIRRGFAFLLRYQFTPGPTQLEQSPQKLAGGFPGSPVDLHVRVDYPQHAGGALLRYWELAQNGPDRP